MSTPPTIEGAKHVKLLANLERVATLIIGVFISVFFLFTTDKRMSVHRKFMSKHEIQAVVVFVLIRLLFIAIVCTFLILLAVKLHRAAKNNDYRSCQIWFWITGTFVALFTFWLLTYLKSGDADGIIVLLSLIYLSYSVYKIHVVLSFMGVLKYQREVDSPNV